MDRRLFAAARGMRDAARSLHAAIERAQDLIYIETPALDELASSADEAGTALWSRLKTRLLAPFPPVVLVCAPLRLALGTPPRLERIRNELLLAATRDAGRVLVFSPAAGPGPRRAHDRDLPFPARQELHGGRGASDLRAHGGPA